MTKITSEQSKEIYGLATRPNNKMSNIELGKKFGISEKSVRRHVKIWESRLHEIAKTNERAASAIASHAVDVHTETQDILKQVKASIQEAKDAGVSPEKLAPLYNNWIKSLELASDLLGKIVVERKVEATWLDEMEKSEAAALNESPRSSKSLSEKELTPAH